MTTNTSQEIVMPEEYKYGLVQWREKDFSIPELTWFQWQMIWGILKTWKITPFPVEESKRLQDIKLERLWYFDANRNSSLPLRDMWTSEEILEILWTLESLRAQSSVFKRDTLGDYDPRELRLDEQLFRRLWIQAYKNQLLWIIDGTITASISTRFLIMQTKQKLRNLWCTEKHLRDFIKTEYLDKL